MRAVSIALLSAMFGCAFARPVQAVEPGNFKERVLYSFCSLKRCADGANPVANLVAVSGVLYGTTGAGGITAPCGCGTVFSLDPGTGTERVLYKFCSQPDCADGAVPSAGLIDVNGITANGTLYGTTQKGGVVNQLCEAPGCGTVFSVNPATGAEKALYAFCGQQNCTDGSYPVAGLIDVNGELFGTTLSGGAGCGEPGCGTAFSIDPHTGAEKVLYSFCSQDSCQDGLGPVSPLIHLNGALYGTTYLGGATGGSGCGELGCGTVFSLDPDTGAETVLHSFGKGADGALPDAGLIDVNGAVFGTTFEGGDGDCFDVDAGCGTVFSLDPRTGVEPVRYSFLGGTDGSYPAAGLIDVQGTLYGTTSAGGGKGCAGSGCGTVFSIDPDTGAETVIYSFCSQENCTDGATPEASLIAVNGVLYGTTYGGGANGYGTVFVLKK